MRDVELLLSDNRGVYIPQNFVQEFDLTKFSGIDQTDIAILESGPDHEWYWDAWDNVLDNARYADGNNVWMLHQDGDLWLICPELMSNEDYENFFGEMKPAPDNAYEYAVCQNCLIALANDDYSGMSDKEEKATRDGLAQLHAEYNQVIVDGAEYGFQHQRCECCDALPGDRYRVLCFDKKGE